MNIEALFDDIQDKQSNVDMSNLTTVKTGGKARLLICPRDETQLFECLMRLNQNGILYFVLGNGSNVLVSDSGFDGVVVKMGRFFGQIELVDDCVLEVGAGAPAASVAEFAAQNSLSGLEFLGSLPATVGGAAVMNAGCFGHCMAEVVEQIFAVNASEGLKCFKKHQLLFDYRSSVFDYTEAIATKIVFRLKKSDKDTIFKETERIKKAKRASQPLDYPSFGSVFKRYDGKSPAVLIDKLGFKGFCVGGAMVSNKHAGFFVNTGNATTENFLTLIDIVGTKVAQKYKVVLQPEVKYLGNTYDLGRLSYTHLV